jgi:hypothetical protein
MRGVRTLGFVVLAACGGSGADPATPDAAIAIDAAAHSDAARTPVRLADRVVAAPGGGDTRKAVDGVQGAGMSSGSTDVYSLGYAPHVNDSITLAWTDATLANGTGDDFAVFENAFATSATTAFMDLVIVEVSRDGATWRAIDHAYTNADPTTYVADPTLWHGFAGRTPVLLDDETNPVDPFDRAAAGGDGFDLDDVLGDDAEAVAIRASGIAFVRLVSAPARVNPDTGATYVHEAISNGGDIDGVYGRYVGP